MEPDEEVLPGMASDDAELAAAARAGDRAAFATLVARHRAALLVACGRLLRDDALAEDAAQEAILTGFLQLERLRRPERFGAWLIGIGLNIGRRWLRARARERRPGAAEGLVERMPAPEAGPDETAEARELAARVRRAVAALPAGQRRAVVAYYLLGLPQREVAALLDTSAGAVKTRLHKARAALGAALAADWHESKEVAMNEQAVSMRVADVCRLEGDQRTSHVAILEEVDGPRSLPIWIGEAEGTALAAALVEADLPRPMTHWLTARLLEAGGIGLAGVRITRLAEHTFYAAITVDGANGPVQVDARPSDALTLALLTNTPVTVDLDVLDAVDAQDRGIPTADEIRAQAQQHADAITNDALAEWERLLAQLREECP